MKMLGPILLTLFALACGDDPIKKQPTSVGGLNQNCYANGTCNTDLICVENRCVSATSNNPNNPNNPNNVEPNNVEPNNLNNVEPNNLNNNSVVCGDGVVGAGEVCDGSNLDGQRCVDLGFEGGGVLECASTCLEYITDGCVRSSCGNGRIDAGETCDGNLLNGNTCQSLGFEGGTLRCGQGCNAYDTSGCQQVGCGDGSIQAGEDCDGTNLGGESCQSLGFDSGTLRCTSSCTYDASNCQNSTLMCDLPILTCNINNPLTCECLGCGTTCSASDCVCESCDGNASCDSCDNNGVCEPYTESCACADCADHPRCLVRP